MLVQSTNEFQDKEVGTLSGLKLSVILSPKLRTAASGTKEVPQTRLSASTAVSMIILAILRCSSYCFSTLISPTSRPVWTRMKFLILGGKISIPVWTASIIELARDATSAKPRFTPCPASGWIVWAASLQQTTIRQYKCKTKKKSVTQSKQREVLCNPWHERCVAGRPLACQQRFEVLVAGSEWESVELFINPCAYLRISGSKRTKWKLNMSKQARERIIRWLCNKAI